MSTLTNTIKALDALRAELLLVDEALVSRNVVSDEEIAFDTSVMIDNVPFEEVPVKAVVVQSINAALEDVPMILNALATKRAINALGLLQLVEQNMRAELVEELELDI